MQPCRSAGRGGEENTPPAKRGSVVNHHQVAIGSGRGPYLNCGSFDEHDDWWQNVVADTIQLPERAVLFLDVFPCRIDKFVFLWISGFLELGMDQAIGDCQTTLKFLDIPSNYSYYRYVTPRCRPDLKSSRLFSILNIDMTRFSTSI
jgi:hypothetical protein